MKPEAERRAAQRLLKAHERGLTTWRALRWTSKARSVHALFLSAAIVGAVVERGDPVLLIAFVCFAGIMLGAMLRDVAWARAQAKAWPLTERIVDWNRVRQIAGGTEVGEPPRHP